MINFILFFCVVVGGLVARAVLGFGFSLFFVPLATLKIGFADAVRLAVAFEFIVSILMAYSYRRELHLADAAWLQICAIIGAALGVVLKSRIDSRVVLASSMGTIILLCLAFLKRISFRVAPSPVKTLMAGGLSGLLNTWSSLSGPPVVLYLLATQASAVSIKGRLVLIFSDAVRGDHIAIHLARRIHTLPLLDFLAGRQRPYPDRLSRGESPDAD